ncbi:MAG: type I DNA topoisomerase [Bacteroidetes bacterium]|uniref:DNA topoisomerase 1 n=1 Tax=Candidatus Cryptobacteroides excrementipullorum TaxID=2840761 RepID=A0A9D9NLR1_9BACT|nr:type I DNA topoisomerase [Candidatus Cryptobacteroides excrementipullorum]
MEENLVIVESPAKAGTIQKFLGKDYVVKSSFGHIRDLHDNSLSIDVEHGFKPEYEIPADKKKVVADLKKAAKAAGTVWLASDEDREGEAISWHLYETLGLKKENTRRIVFHEITKNAILHAIENPRDIDMNLVDAQQARRVLDRLVGFELSPILWKKIQPKLSAGRVQSVALRLIVDREREIMNFRKEQYYRVEAAFHPASAPAGIQVKAVLDTKFPDIDAAEEFLHRCSGAVFSIRSIDKKEGVRFPAAPFTTSSLQQEAARKLRFSVSQTMGIAQKLYEAGYITYMRTDSTNLSTLALNTSKKYICENFGEEYSRTRQYKTKAKGAQEAHEAIRPTYIEHTEIPGTPQEKKLYDLIWKRTVASQMADAKVMKTDIKVGHDKGAELFSIQATEVLFDGFLKLYMESTDEPQEDDEILLPELSTGEVMEEQGMTAECKFTAPPMRYSEATLVKKLEELGIGRPSTYAPTISTLTKGRGYIIKGDKEGEKIQVTNLVMKDGTVSRVRKTETVGAGKGRLLPQEIGMIVTDYLVDNFSRILDYGFTADVEKDFDKVAEGKMPWNELIASFYSPFHDRVEKVLNDHQYSHVSRELGTDPKDGKPIVAKYGQYGPYVQKGEGEDRQFASLAPGQLIESITLEDALKLFELPRTVGEYNGVSIVCTKGRFGPYIKYGDRNISLPRGADPISIDLDSCIKVIEESATRKAGAVISNFEQSDIQVIDGNYGAYIKHAGQNYRIPKGTDAAALTEEACKEIISSSKPTNRRARRK